ncbi:unnamed protein product [Nyctereutes procyonoides]|uniref:(raccoon dog) hypothetical protein n=1 Tax=Nyctereutes procyonoides TaxID=34880 RepID=A0A811YWB9_NYCPR|nr:unnamed protein product [Nyctereutes procyonoides]
MWEKGRPLAPRVSVSLSCSLQPPTPETDYPESLTSYPEEDYSPVGSLSEPRPTSPLTAPPGWSCHVSPKGHTLYTNHYTQEQWVRLEDQHGQPYFYNPEDTSVQWELPQVPVLAPRSICKSNQDSETPAQACPPEEKIKTLDKAGVLHGTKTVDKGKRLRKKHWSASWTVLEGGVLTFFKDSKASAAGALPPKLCTPEYTVELRGASLSWAPKEKSSRKNVLEGALSSDRPATAPASNPPGSLGSRARMGKGHPRTSRGARPTERWAEGHLKSPRGNSPPRGNWSATRGSPFQGPRPSLAVLGTAGCGMQGLRPQSPRPPARPRPFTLHCWPNALKHTANPPKVLTDLGQKPIPSHISAANNKQTHLTPQETQVSFGPGFPGSGGSTQESLWETRMEAVDRGRWVSRHISHLPQLDLLRQVPSPPWDRG